MSEIGEYCSYVADRLRLRYPPLSILFTEKPPANAQRVNNATFCELVVRSLKSGKMLCAGPDDIDCLVGAATLGLKPIPEDVAKRLVEAKHFGPYTLQFLSSLPKMPEQGRAEVVISQPGDVTDQPQITLFAGDSEQINRLVSAWIWVTGKPLNAVIQGIAAVCSGCVAHAYVSDNPSVMALPCVGAKELGKLEANLALFAIPTKLLKELVNGLKSIEAPEAEVERYVIDLLTKRGKVTTRDLIKEIVNLYPHCPDYPAQFLATLRSKGKVKCMFSPEKGEFVWYIRGELNENRS